MQRLWKNTTNRLKINLIMKKLVKESLNEEITRYELMQIRDDLEELWKSEKTNPDWKGKTFDDFANDPTVLKLIKSDGAKHGWKKDNKGNLVRRTINDIDDEKVKYF